MAPARVDVAEQRETRLGPVATYRPHRWERHDHVAELTTTEHQNAARPTQGAMPAQLFVCRFDDHGLVPDSQIANTRTKTSMPNAPTPQPRPGAVRIGRWNAATTRVRLSMPRFADRSEIRTTERYDATRR